MPMQENHALETSSINLGLDLLIVGGGLAGGLLAWRINLLRPDLKFRLLEAGTQLGGEHTWSFHESDLTASQLEWIKPLVSRSWPGHLVRFPGEKTDRRAGHYFAIRSHDFNQTLTRVLGERVSFGSKVKSMATQQVQLENGERLNAKVVIDASGMPTHENLECGWQKFVGYDLVLKKPHGLELPFLMDADVEQIDGFRFFYVLPWDERTLLLEDTFYSSNNEVDLEKFQARIFAYAAKNDWEIESIGRREVGCLPIPISRLPQGGCRQDEAPAIGTSSGLFHMTTGYSLPDSVRVIDRIATLPDFSVESAREAIRGYRKAWEPRQNFYRFLNRMLFRAADAPTRYKVLQRFYRLSGGLVQRFYAGQTTTLDRIKILTGKPPVPVFRAVRCWLDHAKGGIQSDRN